MTIELKDDRSEKVHYDSLNYPIYIRRAMLSQCLNYTAPSHWHDDIELIYIISGFMDYNVNGNIIRLHEGEGIFVNSRQVHYGFSNEQKDCDYICILLHPLLLCTTLAYEQEFVSPLINNDALPYVKLNKHTDWQSEILKQIYAIYENRHKNASPLYCQAAFSAIWFYLCDNLPVETVLKKQSGNLTIIRNMVGYIQKNYAETITLKEIAAAGSVGESKCCQLFKKFFTQTPIAYLNQYRLNKSLDFLRDTDFTVSEIALITGFGSASYYAETFRKYYKQSPSDFRKQQINQTKLDA